MNSEMAYCFIKTTVLNVFPILGRDYSIAIPYGTCEHCECRCITAIHKVSAICCHT